MFWTHRWRGDDTLSLGGTRLPSGWVLLCTIFQQITLPHDSRQVNLSAKVLSSFLGFLLLPRYSGVGPTTPGPGPDHPWLIRPTYSASGYQDASDAASGSWKLAQSDKRSQPLSASYGTADSKTQVSRHPRPILAPFPRLCSLRWIRSLFTSQSSWNCPYPWLMQ
jgi:hypothetical protein